MEISRRTWIGLGALGFIGGLAFMLPPTHPLTAPTRPHVAAAPDPWAHYQAPPEIAYAAPPPTIETAPPVPAPTSAPAPEAAPVRRAPPVEVERVGAEDERGDIDDRVIATPLSLRREFAAGYDWAERASVEDPRECRRWRGSPREDGCRAYLQDHGDGPDEEAWRGDPNDGR